jgi:hypothetical protein
LAADELLAGFAEPAAWALAVEAAASNKATAVLPIFATVIFILLASG